jgi:hyperosmotically inducible periplasmic protein
VRDERRRTLWRARTSRTKRRKAMRKTHWSCAAALALAVTTAAGCSSRKSQQEPSPKATETPAADNTAVNQRDRLDSERTADQADQDRDDVVLTAKIRQSLVDDDALSTDAKNVKIIVEDGMVTLKGPVGSLAEKTLIEQKAIAFAGDKNVVSELAVETDEGASDPGDVGLTNKIRQSLVDDGSLSTQAKTIDVSSKGGVVTLKGTVKSAAEKKLIEQKAIAFAGEKNVVSELRVAP